MNMTKEQVQSAIVAGLALTNPESDVLIPIRHAPGALVLHQLLLALASGQVQLSVTNPVVEPPAPPVEPPAPPVEQGRKKK